MISLIRRQSYIFIYCVRVLGSVIKKPVVIEEEVVIREILHMTILMDHDVIDGGPMVRFLNDLKTQIKY